MSAQQQQMNMGVGPQVEDACVVGPEVVVEGIGPQVLTEKQKKKKRKNKEKKKRNKKNKKMKGKAQEVKSGVCRVLEHIMGLHGVEIKQLVSEISRSSIVKISINANDNNTVSVCIVERDYMTKKEAINLDNLDIPDTDTDCILSLNDGEGEQIEVAFRSCDF